jgi:phenylalanyl-tRNA synthetase beta subunit
MLTFSLCARDEAFGHLRRADADVAVHIANPQTQQFQICRPSLLPGTLKTFQANKSLPLPHKFFECSDVVLLDAHERTAAPDDDAVRCSSLVARGVMADEREHTWRREREGRRVCAARSA